MNNLNTEQLEPPYQPTWEELKGNDWTYCYGQNDVWTTPEATPFIVTPEEAP